MLFFFQNMCIIWLYKPSAQKIESSQVCDRAFAKNMYHPEKGNLLMFLVLAGGLLIVIIAVIVAVVSSVVSAVAADQDIEE